MPFSVCDDTNFSKLKPSLACKIFDGMISPILLYNSEIWGGYVKSDFKAWDGSQIERTHLQFCKRYLEVSKRLLMLHVELNLVDFLSLLPLIKESSTT